LREKPVAAIARDLGISDSCLRNWIAQADIDNGTRAGLSSDEPEPDLPPQPFNFAVLNYSGIGDDAGQLRVFWESGPDAFEYTYSITINSGTPSGQPLSGTLASGSSFNVIYNLEPNSSISVILTSLTNPPATTSDAFSRG
jgi:hypothetical protein